VAGALAKHRGCLTLSGLMTLSPEEADGDGFRIDGLPTLSPEVGAELAKHKGGLNLDQNFTTLSDGAAEALAKIEGPLALDGLRSLTPDAARALAKHDGPLALNSLSTITDEAAEALAKHESDLFLEGLTEISPEAAATLRSNPKVVLPERFR
jgi:hypothetical protein